MEQRKQDKVINNTKYGTKPATHLGPVPKKTCK